MSKIARQIYSVSSKAYMEAIKVYETELPEELQTNETFDFFIQCLQKTLTEDLFRWSEESFEKYLKNSLTTDSDSAIIKSSKEDKENDRR